MATTIDQLPLLDGNSGRIEHYLDNLCGRAVTIDQLPNPESRTEEYLEYICHNGVIGGGGGLTEAQVNNIVREHFKNARLENKELVFITHNGNEHRVDLSKFVTDWEDLSYTSIEVGRNLFDQTRATFYPNKVLADNGTITDNNAWTIVKTNFTLIANQSYRLYKKISQHDSATVVFFDSNNSRVNNIRTNSGYTAGGGWRYYNITVPADCNNTYMAFNIHHDSINTLADIQDKIMVFEGNTALETSFIPYTETIEIDGENVKTSFTSNTGLASTKIDEAIDEVNTRVSVLKPVPFLVATDLGLFNDGQTDNSGLLQSLVQQSNVQGKTIFFPKGTYILGQVGLRSKLHFVGEPGTIFKIKDGSDNIFNISGQDDIKFEYIDLFGGGITNRPSILGTKVGINMTASRRISFENCTFRGFDKAGLYVTQQGAAGNHLYSYNLFINACRFEQSYYGMMFDVRAEYANIVGSTFGQNYIGAFVGGGNNQFANCQFNSNTIGMREVGGTTEGVNYANNSHNSFTGCQFNHNGTHSIKLDNIDVGIMFTGCQFYDGRMEFTGTTKGVIFSVCEGGTWYHISNQSGKVMFTDCYFHTPPTKQGNNISNTIYHNNLPDDVFDSSKFVTESGNNNFTASNNFEVNKPTVTKYEDVTGFTINGTTTADASYYVNLGTTINANTDIDSIAIPIANSQVGDEVDVTVFAVNTDTGNQSTGNFVEYIVQNKIFAVTNKEFNSQKCIIVPINKSYSHTVAFGFRIPRRTVSGRTIGIMYDNSGGANTCWGRGTAPQANETLTATSPFKFSYTTISKNIVEVATMDDISDIDINEVAKLNSGNNFTQQNNFDNYIPTITKFGSSEFSVTGARAADNNYYVNLNNFIIRDTNIDSLLIPITSSIIGDSVNVTVFAVNTDTKDVIEYIYQDEDLTVVDKQFNGYYCVSVPINKSYDHNVAFGFRVIRKTIAGRTLGLYYDTSSASNSSWVGTAPNIGDNLNPTGNIKISHSVITYNRSNIVIEDDILDYVKLNSENNFTNNNNFDNRPTVSKIENKTVFTSDGVSAADNNHYISFDNYAPGNTLVEFLIIPITNSKVGNIINTTVFVANTDTKQFIEYICRDEDLVIRNHESENMKCLIVKVDKIYGYNVSFGFRINRQTIDGNQVGLKYSTGGSANSSWAGAAPQVGQILRPTQSFKFSYAIASRNRIDIATIDDIGGGNIDTTNISKLNEENLFTDRNTFEYFSPVVRKNFALAKFGAAANNLAIFETSMSVIDLSRRFESGKYISNILVPILNAKEGDFIFAALFILNADSRVIKSELLYTNYQVIKSEYLGCKCIAIPVNQQYQHETMFGFRVQARTTSDNRRIGLAYQINGGQSWVGSAFPNVGNTISSNQSYMFPYLVCQHAESEIVTRFDLDNNTFPYVIAETKVLAYDAGEKTSIGNSEWLRCDGQSVSSDEYGELSSLINNKNTRSDSFNLPDYSGVGYMYICAKKIDLIVEDIQNEDI